MLVTWVIIWLCQETNTSKLCAIISNSLILRFSSFSMSINSSFLWSEALSSGHWKHKQDKKKKNNWTFPLSWWFFFLSFFLSGYFLGVQLPYMNTKYLIFRKEILVSFLNLLSNKVIWIETRLSVSFWGICLQSF